MARERRRITGDERYYAAMERNSLKFADRIEAILARPFKILFQEPMLFVLTIYLSVRNISCTVFISSLTPFLVRLRLHLSVVRSLSSSIHGRTQSEARSIWPCVSPIAHWWFPRGSRGMHVFWLLAAGLMKYAVRVLCKHRLFSKDGGICSRACTTRIQVTRSDDCIAVTHRIFLLVCVSCLPNDYPLKI